MSSNLIIRDQEYRRLSWSAIFGGAFVFLAIEVTFGVLGIALFASTPNAVAAKAFTAEITTRLGIWMVVVSIIALYFGGRCAALLSQTRSTHVGMYHGLVTFGLSIVSSVLVTSVALGGVDSGAPAHASALGFATVADIVAACGFWLFAALILGLLAAFTGGRQGVERCEVNSIDRGNITEARRVA